MQHGETWRIGRLFGHGQWLGDSLEDSIQQIGPMCRRYGYRKRDVCVWREGTVDNYMVGEQRGHGGVAASNLKEAIELRGRMEKTGMGRLVITKRDKRDQVTATDLGLRFSHGVAS